jgi:hypothetical protein
MPSAILNKYIDVNHSILAAKLFLAHPSPEYLLVAQNFTDKSFI